MCHVALPTDNSRTARFIPKETTLLSASESSKVTHGEPCSEEKCTDLVASDSHRALFEKLLFQFFPTGALLVSLPMALRSIYIQKEIYYLFGHVPELCSK